MTHQRPKTEVVGGTGWHMGRSDFFGKLPCAFCAGTGDGPKPDTRPAPLVGEDVVEAMADAHYQAGIDNRPKPKMDSRFQMQQALKAAEAMGYTLTKQDRVLPELPEGWELITIDAKTIGDDALYTCEINQFIGLDRIDVIVREGKAWQAAYRAAVLAAIGKIGTK